MPRNRWSSSSIRHPERRGRRLIPYAALVAVQGCAPQAAAPPDAARAVPAAAALHAPAPSSPAPSAPAPSSLALSSPEPAPAAHRPTDPRAKCLAPRAGHSEPSPCPATADAAACRFVEGTEYFKRKDYPAAAERFIPLSLEQPGQLGRASAENALVSIVSLARDPERPDCRALYHSLAPRIVERHCPLPQSASDQGCHALHRLHFNLQKATILEDFERSSQPDKAQTTAAASDQLFDRYCIAAGALNNVHQAPVAAGCDELLSNAYRLSVQLGDADEAKRIRAKFLDPANRLAASPYVQDFSAASSPRPSSRPERP